ncbi:MAG: MarR family transcriptional regulator, partial [Actinomycetota bacterium]|nr:MarR family transcriptional regulator [Actinomycetota bacterium]
MNLLLRSGGTVWFDQREVHMLDSASSAETSGKASAAAQPQPGPVTLTRHIGYLLRRAYVRSNDCARACVPDDTHLREVAILALIAERQPISQRELGELLLVNRSMMVKLLDSIAGKGWVVRARNPRDRRSYALRLTESGHRALSGRLDDLSGGDDVLTARLSTRERRWLNRALLDLLDNRELAPIASLSEHSGYLIAQAHHQMRRRAIERLAPIGLHPRDFGVLNVLAETR